MNERSNELDFADALERLQVISRTCVRLSSMIGIFTLTHLIVDLGSVYAAFFGGSIFPFPQLRAFITLLFLLDGMVLFATIVLIWRFDRTFRIGNFYYQELSDAVELEQTNASMLLKLRLTLREFAVDATLPFLRKADNAPMVYIGANVVLTAFMWSSVVSLLKL